MAVFVSHFHKRFSVMTFRRKSASAGFITNISCGVANLGKVTSMCLNDARYVNVGAADALPIGTAAQVAVAS
jgi:hypothetical protein